MRRASVVLAAFCLIAAMGAPAAGRHVTHAAACANPTGAYSPPPAGFNALTASNADLACYGIPQRPTDATALKVWTALVGPVKQWVPLVTGKPIPAPARPAASVVANSLPDITNPLLGGYKIYAGNISVPNLYFDAAEAAWVVPSPAQYDNEDYFAHWIGLGPEYSVSGDLVQAGTEMWDAYSGPYFFYENYPGPEYPVTSVPVRNGDFVVVSVAYGPPGLPTGYANYCFTNGTTGKGTCTGLEQANNTYNVTSFAGSYLENQGSQGGYYCPFNPLQFGMNWVEGRIPNQPYWIASWYFNYAPASRLILMNGTQQYGVPTALNTNGAYQVNYQTGSGPSCP